MFSLAVIVGGSVLIFALVYYAAAQFIFIRRIWALPRRYKWFSFLPALTAFLEWGTVQLQPAPGEPDRPEQLVCLFATFLSMVVYVVWFRRIRHALRARDERLYKALYRPIASMFAITIVAIAVGAALLLT